MVFGGALALHARVSQCGLLLLKRFYSPSYNMQNVYVRFPSGSSTFNVTFHYSNQKLGIDRKFNLMRQSSETVSTFLQRVEQNLQKTLDTMQLKKKRRLMKKKNAGSEESTAAESTSLDDHPTVTAELTRSGTLVSTDEICSSVLNSNELLMLSVMGKKYHIVLNAPWIDSIQLPSSILSGFPVYPCKLCGDSFEKLDSLFRWYRRQKESDQWLQIGSGFVYTPSSDDIGYKLKVECEPRKGSVVGPPAEAVANCLVEAGPGLCPFEIRHAFTQEPAQGNSFRVVSYNILAGLYSDTDVAKTDLFSHCPMYALDIDYRKQLFLKEILGYNADIICLQEVDSRVFHVDLCPVLSLKGFQGIFHNKGSVSEGLACFVNSRKFRLINSYLSILGAELSQRPCYARLWEKLQGNEPLIARLKDRATSSQATVLQSNVNPNEWLVVGNTHLYFHPDADHIRLLQGGLSILFLEEIVERVKTENPDAKVSLLLCGDFNSTPDCGIFHLMTKGYVPEDFVDWKSNETEAVTNVSLNQPFKLDSACGTPQFTNYTVGFAECIDYIFYQTDNFKVKQVIPFYSEEELKRYIALPNVVFPSDHVALVADLESLDQPTSS